jgi:hypothetical protein
MARAKSDVDVSTTGDRVRTRQSAARRRKCQAPVGGALGNAAIEHHRFAACSRFRGGLVAASADSSDSSGLAAGFAAREMSWQRTHASE